MCFTQEWGIAMFMFHLGASNQTCQELHWLTFSITLTEMANISQFHILLKGEHHDEKRGGCCIGRSFLLGDWLRAQLWIWYSECLWSLNISRTFVRVLIRYWENVDFAIDGRSILRGQICSMAWDPGLWMILEWWLAPHSLPSSFRSLVNFNIFLLLWDLLFEIYSQLGC